MPDNVTDPAALHAVRKDPREAAHDPTHRSRRGSAYGSTIGTLLSDGEAHLRGADHASARLESELLLAHALGTVRSHLLAWPDEAVQAPVCASFVQLLRRAGQGEPLAYLLGEREFWSLPLAVSPAVLIPRPETELLVERCLALGEQTGASAVGQPHGHNRVCDLGTGSGAIALALAAERPRWQLTATDRSAAALQIARANAARLGAQHVRFLQGPWYGPLNEEKFDLIVTNPPYVAATDPALAQLRYEPMEALTPGPTGLEALAELIAGAPLHLLHGGWLVLEHGADQAASVTQLLHGTGYARIMSHRDLAGHLRVTEARWP